MFSRGGSLLPSVYADVRAILMPSSHSEGTGVVVSDIMRMETPWRKCEDNVTERDYCYGSCGTAHQYSSWTAAYLRRMVASLKRVEYGGKALLYLHPFISTETGRSKPPLATENLLEVTGGLCPPPRAF